MRSIRSRFAKSLTIAAAAACLLAAPSLSGTAAADGWHGGYGYGGYGHGYHHNGWGAGLAVGALTGLALGAALAPGYYAPPPPPVYYAPPPVYYTPPPAYYAPPPALYVPQPYGW